MTALTHSSLITTGAAGAAAGFLVNTRASTARAATQSPATGSNVPFYHTRVGSADVIVVSEGTIQWAPTDPWSKVAEEDLDAFLSDFHQPTDYERLQLNEMVMDLNGRRVLIDTGCAGKWQPTGGGLP